MRTAALLFLATSVACATLAAQTLSSIVPASPVYPLKASANGRYLTDSNGVPFLLMGDSPQSMIANITPLQMSGYMSNRQAMGFNSILVDALCTAYTGGNGNGTAYDGTPPFTSGTDPSNYDLSTPNSGYFAELDSLVNLAASYHLAVVLDPIETGGWLVTLENNGPSKAYNFGVYLGNRYRSFANIVWQSGNDFQTWNSSQTDNSLVHQVMLGIASTDPVHLQTIELNYNFSYSNQDTTLSDVLTWDACYTYYETYDCFVQAYASSPVLPLFLTEANYEYENNTGQLPGPAGPYVLREEAYWTLTSGGAGQLYGNHYTWLFPPGWQLFLLSPGAREIKYINSLFATLPWQNLVPDTAHHVVTAGYGTYDGGNADLTTSNYCTTAWVPGAYALTYCPQATTLTVNLAEFTGFTQARWYDPSNGTFLRISGSPFRNSGTHNFTTPGNNHDGNPDWVLDLYPATGP
ncbi:MAG: DUF4038 domain-containing protein [Candidatus Korobacteraceae bacterium]